MPNWKKVAISGSNISQFNNDGIYTKMSGSTANGLLTYHSAETASVESKITYNGTTQELNNHGKIVAFSGSQFSTASPPAGNGALVGFKSPLVGSPWSPVSGSRNHSISAITRYTNFGSGNQCAATIGINAQKGDSDKNAIVELSSIAKEDGCHDAIFSIGVRCDAGAGAIFHPTEERFRIDGATAKVAISGSLLVKPSYVVASASLDNILVYDNNTGEIKKSTLTPPTSNAVTSVNGATGAVTLAQITNGSGIVSGSAGASGNVQYNDGSSGFAAESSFTYDASTDKLTIKNPGTGAGGLITNNIEGAGLDLTISDGGNDKKIAIMAGDADICMSAWGSERVVIEDGQTKLCEAIITPNLTVTAATDCPSVVISTTGELLKGPVGGAGTTPTLCQVTSTGNTTDQNIVLDNSTTNCLTVSGATNCIKVTDNPQSGAGRPLLIKGSDNSSTTAGVGGNISICAGNATGVSGAGDGGTILIKGGTTTNAGSDPGYVCVEGHGLVVPNGQSSEPGIAFAGDVSMGLWRTNDCVVISRDGQQGTTSHYFGADGYKICNGALAVGNISYSTTTGRIDASNDIVAYSTSDCRLKKYVKPIKNALDKIDKIRGVEFDWKVTDEKIKKEVHSFEGHDVGVIAQEIEAVLPEVVTTRDSGYKAVKYEKIVPLLIQGIKELKDEVEILKTKI